VQPAPRTAQYHDRCTLSGEGRHTACSSSLTLRCILYTLRCTHWIVNNFVVVVKSYVHNKLVWSLWAHTIIIIYIYFITMEIVVSPVSKWGKRNLGTFSDRKSYTQNKLLFSWSRVYCPSYILLIVCISLVNMNCAITKINCINIFIIYIYI